MRKNRHPQIFLMQKNVEPNLILEGISKKVINLALSKLREENRCRYTHPSTLNAPLTLAHACWMVMTRYLNTILRSAPEWLYRLFFKLQQKISVKIFNLKSPPWNYRSKYWRGRYQVNKYVYLFLHNLQREELCLTLLFSLQPSLWSNSLTHSSEEQSRTEQPLTRGGFNSELATKFFIIIVFALLLFLFFFFFKWRDLNPSVCIQSSMESFLRGCVCLVQSVNSCVLCRQPSMPCVPPPAPAVTSPPGTKPPPRQHWSVAVANWLSVFVCALFLLLPRAFVCVC